MGGAPRSGGQARAFSNGGSGLGQRPAGGRGGMMRGGAAGSSAGREEERNRRDRADYLREEEETWVGDRRTAPPVVD
ncbi:hypothetical protein GT354_46200 [Streptomyces sp. SID3343]|nr:hypothetical protein [Streptomyces sp. SID3343]